MPQDGSNNYYYPPGTPGVPDQTIESEAYNTFIDDLVANDLNIVRPIHRGGTGANNANEAVINLGAEKSTQVVTEYLMHLWVPGSFRSVGGATDEPVNGHNFSGVCYINEPLAFPPTNQNVTIEARDHSDATIPGRLYVRQKKAGVWDAAWSEQVGDVIATITANDARYVNVSGDTMDGQLVVQVAAGPTNPARKDYVDTYGAALQANIDLRVAKAGDIMTGHLGLPTGPAATQAVRKDYVDAADAALNASITTALNGKVAKTGDTMTGDLTMTRSGAPGHGLIQFGNSGTKYLFFDGARWLFNGSPITTPGLTSNGLVTVNAPSNNVGLLVYGANALAAYAIETHARYTECGGLIGWSINDIAYGICGGFFSGYYSFYGSGTAYIAGGTWTTSDGRLKNVSGDADPVAALAAVNSLPVKKYTPSSPAASSMMGAREGEPETLYGWVAQDVELIVPVAVRDIGIPAHDKKAREAVGGETLKAINDRYMLTTLWAAVQQLSAQNEAMKVEIEALKAAA